jgi:glutamyl-tRNA reductase
MNASSGRALDLAPSASNRPQSAQSVLLVGTSLRTAGVATRDRIAKRLDGISGLGFQVAGGKIFENSVFLTCNRIEVYFACRWPDEVARSVMAELDGDGTSSQNFYVKTGFDAIRHIFRVASGLDSPVLGEEQILQQVKKAGRTARMSGQAKSILSSLFEAAYNSGKRIRGSYAVIPSNRSVSAFALRHAIWKLGHQPTKVLLIGSGEIARIATLALEKSHVYILSSRPDIRTRFPNAVRISRRSLRKVSKKCELIIAATKHDGYVLSKGDLPEKRKTVVLDLGFPRNVDPSLQDTKFIQLYDLDAVAAWALSLRHHRKALAERLLKKETRSFEAWLIASRLTPTLANIYKWAEMIREEETVAALRKLSSISSHDRTIIQAMSRRLTGKLLSPHATFVKEIGNRKDQKERLLLLESIFRNEDK